MTPPPPPPPPPERRHWRDRLKELPLPPGVYYEDENELKPWEMGYEFPSGNPFTRVHTLRRSQRIKEKENPNQFILYPPNYGPPRKKVRRPTQDPFKNLKIRVIPPPTSPLPEFTDEERAEMLQDIKNCPAPSYTRRRFTERDDSFVADCPVLTKITQATVEAVDWSGVIKESTAFDDANEGAG